MSNPSPTPSSTKLCSACRAEVPFDAKKCQHCRQDLRSWPRRHPIWTFILGLLLFSAILTAVSGNGSSTVASKPSVVASTTQTTEPAPSLRDELSDAIKNVNKFDGSVNRRVQAELGAENPSLTIFKNWTNLVIRGKTSTSTEEVALAKDLERKVSAVQIKEFPLMRKIYADQMHTKLWESDIDVSVGGARNETLRLVGSAFITNKNIKTAGDAAYENLLLFRFDKMDFSWYKGGDHSFFTLTDDARYRKDGDVK